MDSKPDEAIGLIETRGVVALAAGIEAMLKTADVEVIAIERISYGYFAAAVRGHLAAVRQALDSGTSAVRSYGQLRAAQMYPRPDQRSMALLDNGSRQALTSATQRALDNTGSS